MTRKEAIAELKRDIELENDFTEDYINAVNMAIEALEQEPGKWISEKVDGEDWKGCKRQYYQPISCSKCHSPNHYKSTYCPHCGSRMGGAE